MKSEWIVKLIENIDFYIGDGNYSSKYPKSSDFIPMGIPFFSASDIKNGKLSLSDARYISPKLHSTLKKGHIKKNDVLIVTRGNGCGGTALVDSEFENANINAQLVLIREGNEVVGQYLYHYMTHMNLTGQINGFITGSAQPQMPIKSIKKIPIIIPPLPIQKKIAHILSTLDDKIELNRKMNQTLEAMAQAIFKSWFVDFDLFKEGEFVDSELGMIPKGWEVKLLTECTKVIGGGTPKTAIPEYWNGDIPWFSVVDTPSGSDVFVVETEKNITQEGLKNSSTKLLEAGTTIVTARGTVGKIALAGISMTMNQSCYALASIDETPYFTYYLVSSSIVELKQKTHGSVFDTITRETLSSIQVVMPSIDAIRGFESTVESMMLKIKENLLETKTLSTLRDALLPKLLSGEVEV